MSSRGYRFIQLTPLGIPWRPRYESVFGEVWETVHTGETRCGKVPGGMSGKRGEVSAVEAERVGGERMRNERKG